MLKFIENSTGKRIVLFRSAISGIREHSEKETYIFVGDLMILVRGPFEEVLREIKNA